MNKSRILNERPQMLGMDCPSLNQAPEYRVVYDCVAAALSDQDIDAPDESAVNLASTVLANILQQAESALMTVSPLDAQICIGQPMLQTIASALEDALTSSTALYAAPDVPQAVRQAWCVQRGEYLKALDFILEWHGRLETDAL